YGTARTTTSPLGEPAAVPPSSPASASAASPFRATTSSSLPPATTREPIPRAMLPVPMTVTFTVSSSLSIAHDHPLFEHRAHGRDAVVDVEEPHGILVHPEPFVRRHRTLERRLVLEPAFREPVEVHCDGRVLALTVDRRRHVVLDVAADAGHLRAEMA